MEREHAAAVIVGTVSHQLGAFVAAEGAQRAVGVHGRILNHVPAVLCDVAAVPARTIGVSTTTRSDGTHQTGFRIRIGARSVCSRRPATNSSTSACQTRSSMMSAVRFHSATPMALKVRGLPSESRA